MWWTVGLLLSVFASPSPEPEAGERMFDLSKDKVLYCIGYAHLDTQWRWDFCTTIDRYIRDTLEQNFARIEEFPGYVFNFTGSVRYEMMKEYYPELYERLKRYIADGRWYVSGSSVDEGDVNVPAPESIIRQVLYGNRFFRREFGKESMDFMLPDCFGFPASLPSIWAHCGLKGFSTQKLTWGSAMGIPFKIGVWEGPDGNSVIAALDPGPYVGAIKGRVDLNDTWVNRIETNGQRYGVWADYHYYGVGDQGGAPHAEDVRNYLASMNNPDGRIRVALTSSDQMYKDITPEQKSRLPRYRGDLLLTEHSAGTLTSQAYMKRWNRKNEQLADAAERAAVAADWFGAVEYPRAKLERCWVRALANQMHDILPGTSIPRAYTYSWNDEIVAMNGFADVLNTSVGAVSEALKTKGSGVPLIVYNPLAIAREDVVEATVTFDGDAPDWFGVIGPDGHEVASQMLERHGRSMKIAFLAHVPPVSWTVFHVEKQEHGCKSFGRASKVSDRTIENTDYRVVIDEDGNIASIVDRTNGDRELLASPAKLVFTHERPQQWPAWNMDWTDRQRPPIDEVRGPATIRIVENGPVRATLEIERRARNSIVRQRVRLGGGEAGRRVEIATEIDWQSDQCALKASFPLTVANPKATYNWGMGTIERGNNEPKKYEVPAHEWFDLTNPSGDYGVSILEDCKYGSDKPSDNELRLTLLYTPGVRSGYLDQHSQDWGRHEITYAIYGHDGDWRSADTEWEARRLNQPLRVWQAEPHGGPLGRQWSLAELSSDQIDIRAIKQAEDGDGIIVRLQELHGLSAGNVELRFPGSIKQAVEVDGQEREVGPATIREGRLITDFEPYRPRTFRLRLGRAPARVGLTKSHPVELLLDTDVISLDADRRDGHFDTSARSIPGEEVPATIVSAGIKFELGPVSSGRPNAITCRGQEIALPRDNYDRLYFLAAANEDTSGEFAVDGTPTNVTIAAWTGFVGQWDNRVWDRDFGEVDGVCEGQVIGIQTGYIKRDPIAWFCTHRHHPEKGNEPYQFSYMYRYAIDLPRRARVWKLPDNPRIKIFAATVARDSHNDVPPAAPLYDDFTDREPIEFRHVYPPPPTPVFEGIAAAGQVIIDRKDTFDALTVGAPSDSDLADGSRGTGLVFRYFDRDGELLPHGRSGAQGDTLPRLNDGAVAESNDDTSRCVWYDNEGRFYLDLGRSVAIKSVKTYSWHRSNRAPQFFSLWGASGDKLPDPGFRHGQHGQWKLLGLVDTRSLGEGGVHGSSVEGPSGAPSLGQYRYLLWVAENVGQGTFFTEIDVYAAE